MSKLAEFPNQGDTVITTPTAYMWAKQQIQGKWLIYEMIVKYMKSTVESLNVVAVQTQDIRDWQERDRIIKQNNRHDCDTIACD